jgi:DNA polymerase sigma
MIIVTHSRVKTHLSTVEVLPFFYSKNSVIIDLKFESFSPHTQTKKINCVVCCAVPVGGFVLLLIFSVFKLASQLLHHDH